MLFSPRRIHGGRLGCTWGAALLEFARCAASQLAVVYRPLDGLKLNPKNPRSHTPRQVCQIARSIQAFGFNMPILVDANLNVIAGHDALLGSDKAALVFTDPPYNVRVQGHVSGKGTIRHREFAIASGEMTETQFTDFLRQTCQLLAAHSADGAMHYVCMDWRHVGELLAASKGAYSELLNICVWAKHNGGMGSLYRSQHELASRKWPNAAKGRTRSQIIFVIASMGTERIMPGIPHIQNQKRSEMMTRTGLRVNRLARSIGVKVSPSIT